MYSNVVNFLCSWSSVDIVGIPGDGDGGKFSPAAESETGMRKSLESGAGKQLPHILCSVDIPIINTDKGGN
jgi:hypothetical protein